jgi:hypothetical protein
MLNLSFSAAYKTGIIEGFASIVSPPPMIKLKY